MPGTFRTKPQPGATLARTRYTIPGPHKPARDHSAMLLSSFARSTRLMLLAHSLRDSRCVARRMAVIAALHLPIATLHARTSPADTLHIAAHCCKKCCAHHADANMFGLIVWTGARGAAILKLTGIDFELDDQARHEGMPATPPGARRSPAEGSLTSLHVFARKWQGTSTDGTELACT